MSAGHGLDFTEEVAHGLHLPAYGNLLAAGAIALALFVLSSAALKKLKAQKNPIIPDSGLSLRNIFELVAALVMNLSDSVMGEHNRKYLPFLCTLFSFVFFMNLLGLLPGFSAPTDGFALNLGIATVVFVMYNAWGMRENGVWPYLKHMGGPVLVLAPLIFVVELVSHVVRPVTLSLRLYGNMTADHMVLSVFTDLTKVVIPLAFYFLGTLVCFLQAFIFTILTMVYIGLAVAHDESH